MKILFLDFFKAFLDSVQQNEDFAHSTPLSSSAIHYSAEQTGNTEHQVLVHQVV